MKSDTDDRGRDTRHLVVFVGAVSAPLPSALFLKRGRLFALFFQARHDAHFTGTVQGVARATIVSGAEYFRGARGRHAGVRHS